MQLCVEQRGEVSMTVWRGHKTHEVYEADHELLKEQKQLLFDT